MVERIEGLLSKVPGYNGYRQKESMRDDDRRLREEMARSLDQAVSDLTALGRQLASNRQLNSISLVEDTVMRTRHLANRVRAASYGYGGIFSDRSVDEHALAQLKAFDVAFQDRVASLAGDITAAASRPTVSPESLIAIQQELAELNKLFDARGDVIETATPAQDQDVLELLEKPRSIGENERRLLNLRRGGTISILGDNYQVSAHIAVVTQAGAPAVTLARLDDSQEWLAVVDDGSAVQTWRVTESDSSVAMVTGKSGSASVSGPQGERSDVPAKYDVTVAGTAGAATVEIHLGLAGNGSSYSGAPVPLIDITVFSEGK